MNFHWLREHVSLLVINMREYHSKTHAVSDENELLGINDDNVVLTHTYIYSIYNIYVSIDRKDPRNRRRHSRTSGQA